MRSQFGFTLIELLVVVVIISIAAVMAVPMMSSSASVQLSSAANLIAADLEYAKNLAIIHQQNYTVVFDDSAESYEIQDNSGTVISHPVNKGFDYRVDFTSGSSKLNKVDIFSVDFDSAGSVEFNYLGSPLNAGGSPLNQGIVTLKAGGTTTTINVAAVTGYISIN
jgi:prepilin-type N-terminal cleavage/methylation domain-containing protein